MFPDARMYQGVIRAEERWRLERQNGLEVNRKDGAHGRSWTPSTLRQIAHVSGFSKSPPLIHHPSASIFLTPPVHFSSPEIPLDELALLVDAGMVVALRRRIFEC